MIPSFRQFTPGFLSPADAEQLNRIARLVENLSRLSVSEPLDLATQSGYHIALRKSFPEIFQVTSNTATDGLYPGKKISYSYGNNTSTQEENVYVRGANDESLTTGYYVGLENSWSSDRTVATVCVPGDSVSGFSLTVKELDGTPSISGVSTISFDQADGYVVTNNAGIAELTFDYTLLPGVGTHSWSKYTVDTADLSSGNGGVITLDTIDEGVVILAVVIELVTAWTDTNLASTAASVYVDNSSPTLYYDQTRDWLGVSAGWYAGNVTVPIKPQSTGSTQNLLFSMGAAWTPGGGYPLDTGNMDIYILKSTLP